MVTSVLISRYGIDVVISLQPARSRNLQPNAIVLSRTNYSYILAIYIRLLGRTRAVCLSNYWSGSHPGLLELFPSPCVRTKRVL